MTGSEPIDEFSVRYALNRTVQLVRLNPVRVGGALLILTFLGAVSDSEALGDGRGLTFVTSLIALAFQYSLTRRLLDQIGVGTAEGAHFFALFGLSFLSTIAITVGLVFLVAPGLFLFVRWSLSVPILLGPADPGIVESLRRSWRETQGRFWPILAVYALIWAVSAAAIAVGVLMEDPVPGAILANLGLNVGLIGGWHAAVAIHSRSDRDATLEEVFA